jgi:glycosyltransferase involved in cell wall biosynthesis
MRVLLISPNFYPKIGGIESHLYEVLNFLRDVRFTVLTDWRREAEHHPILFPEVDFHYVWPRDRSLRRLAQSSLTIRSYRAVISAIELLRLLNRAGWMDRLDADVIHIHYFNLDQLDRTARRLGLERLIPRWYGWLTAKARCRAPVLFTDHTVFSAPQEIVPQTTKLALLKSFRDIISVDRMSHEVVRNYQEAHGGRSWLVPNSVDTDRFSVAPRSHDRSRGRLAVGYAARIGKLGQNLLREVRRELGFEVDWRFALGGARIDLLKTELRAAFPSARFFENIDYSRMPEFYHSIDVLVNPFPAEGIGRTTLEAMSCGVPVIGVGTGDKYPLRSEETGFLVPVSPRAIAAKLLDLALQPELARDLGNRAREVIVKEFSNRSVLPRLRDVYRVVGEQATAS